MESSTLLYSLDLVSGNGLTLSPEQRAALHTSLIILRRNHRFHRVLFWGKILGIKNDYFIAQGVGEDEMKDRKSLYSFNCMDWHLLPQATEALISDVDVAAKGRFIGDPSYVHEHTEIQHREEGGNTVEEEVMVKVSEERRLAVTVFTIDKEVAVVPRGAYIKNPHGTVQTNRSFQGLSPTEAAKLSNYLHFTDPRNLKKKSILEMANLNPSIDFLDPLSDDIPKENTMVIDLIRGKDETVYRKEIKHLVTWCGGNNLEVNTTVDFRGSWSLQFEHGSRVCVVRSLLWFGLTFFHIPETSQHGYIYMGDGLKNLDLPFMM